MLEDTMLLELDEDSLKEMLEDVPPLVLALIKNVIRKLIDTEEKYLKTN